MNTVPNNALQAGTPDPRIECPLWCVSRHLGEDDLISHEGVQHYPGISIMRTDCPDELRVGKPVVYVAVQLELETNEQAIALAYAILAAADQLGGANR